MNSLTWETSELQKTTYGLANHVKLPLPPRESKPFLQNASLFAKQILFFFFFPVGLDSLTQVYQENSSTLQGEKKKKKCSELQNKFLKG